MSSPLLNEAAIVAALDPGADITIDSLRRVAMHTLMDAYDRKVKRDVFFEIECKVVELIASCVVQEFSLRLLSAYQRAETTSPALEGGIEATANTITHARLALIKHVQMLMECPEDTDKIN